MQKKVDLKMVKEVVKELQDKGEPVTVRKILAITGGSMTTVSMLYREAQEGLAAAALVPNPNLPTSIGEAIQDHVTTQVVAAISQLKAELAAARAREDETIGILGVAEEQLEKLHQELEHARQEIASLRLQAEKSAATSAQFAEGLTKQLEDLRTDHRLLAESGEAARTALAMAELERKKAEGVADRAEAKSAELQTKYETLLGQHAGFEKRLAAEKAAAEQKAAQSEQRALDLDSQRQFLEGLLNREREEAKEDRIRETEVLADRIKVTDDALARAEERAARVEAELRELRKPSRHEKETEMAANI